MSETVDADRRLRTFDDVAWVCETLGLTRLDPDRWHPFAWFSREHGIGVAVSCLGPSMGGVHVQRGEHPDDTDDENEGEQVATVVPYVAGSGALLAAVLRALIAAPVEASR